MKKKIVICFYPYRFLSVYTHDTYKNTLAKYIVCATACRYKNVYITRHILFAKLFFVSLYILFTRIYCGLSVEYTSFERKSFHRRFSRAILISVKFHSQNFSAFGLSRLTINPVRLFFFISLFIIKINLYDVTS